MSQSVVQTKVSRRRRVKKVVIQTLPAQSAKPGKAARRRRNRQRRRAAGVTRPGTAVSVMKGVAGGNLTTGDVITRYSLARGRRRGRRSKIGSVRGLAPLFDIEQDVLWDFVEKHLDPNGEFEVLTENARIPDGANPNSVAIELREADNIRPPLVGTRSLPLNGDLWCLTMIHTNSFRTPLIMIAGMGNIAPDTEVLAKFSNTWNVGNADAARYPNWVQLGDTSDFYYSWYGWSALDSVATPSIDGVSTAISRWRICADGLTVGFNTPTFVDQGWAVSAQIAPDFSHETPVAVVDSETDTVTEAVAFVRRNNGTEYFLSTPWESNMSIITTTGSSSPLTVSRAATISTGSVQFSVSAGDLVRLDVAGLSPFVANYLVSTDSGTTWTNRAVLTTSGLLNATWNADFSFAALDPVPGIKINRAKLLDVVSSGALYQISPQAFMCTLKETLGLYVVKRVWNPVFNMTNASTYAPFRFANTQTDPATLTATTGGKYDTLDMNFGMSYTQFNGISTSAQPVIKMRRVVEIIADSGSPYAPFMVQGSDRIEEALVIVKEFADRHPHAYPAGYNGFGQLFSIVSGVLDKIPIIGNVTKPLVSVLHQLLAGGNADPKPGSSNIKQELDGNVQELLSALLQKLGL